ncbi:SDR family oxidoreductase [Roseateles asaccharophilus]|uniref:NAD(P)-dependent dehydrogenase (Short-subunit alcohol dehydrogenase family) n=1 Tax=Roseateles asaccharophilus TaxID=582607 RepID=A0ABU2ACF9_9BURK|nr:SDR family oxidoreductase [Roseateles asaccharophilus]MDR7334700.1 NAD(P)-dependent dehydrogenase (short-subunit alcohol dehydrogenase family) [Roseateles asaccharophilus]
MQIFNEHYLAGKRVLVTGASSGIGRQAAITLAACGARVCLSGRDAGRLQATLDLLPGAGHTLLPLDLNGDDGIADAIQADAKASGSFFAAFHAAGVSMVRQVKLCKSKQFDDVFASSVQSAMAISRAMSLRGVMDDGGALVLMSSVAGLRGQAGMSLYSAAKAAIDGLARSLAVEFAPRGIRVNSVSAGAVETPMHDSLLTTLNGESVEAYRSKHLLGFGSVNDVANAVAFLVGEGGRWITGTSLVVDGGYTVR